MFVATVTAILALATVSASTPAYTFNEPTDFFSDTFVEADSKFVDVCTTVAGAQNLRTYTHPTALGKQGEALTSRVCLLGPRDAPNVLYALTGVHGAEGFSGAAAMLKFMLEMSNASSVYLKPVATRYVLHHMVEPWGASFGFKENEDNVDQLKNSNGLYEKGHPGWTSENRANPIFVELIGALDIPHLDTYKPTFSIPLQRFQAMGVKYGEAFGASLRKGQMQRQVGMSFWGTEQSWSSSVQKMVAADYLSGAEKVVLLDLHTAVGEYGKWSIYAYDLHSESVFQQWIELSGIDKSMTNLNVAGVALKPWQFYTYIEKFLGSGSKSGGSSKSSGSAELAEKKMVRVVWEAGTYPQEQYQLFLVLGMHCRFFMTTTSFTKEECAQFEAKISQYFYPNFDDYKKIAMEDLEVASKALFVGMKSWFGEESSPSSDDDEVGRWVFALALGSYVTVVLVGALFVLKKGRRSGRDDEDVDGGEVELRGDEGATRDVNPVNGGFALDRSERLTKMERKVVAFDIDHSQCMHTLEK